MDTGFVEMLWNPAKETFAQYVERMLPLEGYTLPEDLKNVSEEMESENGQSTNED